LFTFDVHPILRLCPPIMCPCLDAGFVDEAATEDHGLDVVLIVSRTIGVRIIGRQTNDTRQRKTLREQTYQVVHHRDRQCHFIKQGAGHRHAILRDLSRLLCRSRAQVTIPRRPVQVGNWGPVEPHRRGAGDEP
jgi:hypothetical protein